MGILIVFISNINATNIYDENRIKDVIVDYLNASEYLIILHKKFDGKECFILYQCNGGPAELAMFEKTLFSFGKFYRETGGASGSSRVNTFDFAEGTSNGWNILIVAFGETRYLENTKYKVIVNNETHIEKLSVQDKYFMKIYRFKGEYNLKAEVDFDMN